MNIKRIIALLTAALLIGCSISGCSKDQTDSDKKDKNEEQNVENKADEKEDKDSDDIDTNKKDNENEVTKDDSSNAKTENSDSSTDTTDPNGNPEVSDKPTVEVPDNVDPEVEDPNSDKTDITVPDDEKQNNEDSQNDEDENDQTTEEKYYSVLTGLSTTQELSCQRPVAIMFNNLKAALPQHGIGDMEVVYEAIVEGKITRLLGVATDWSSLGTLGSIRSSRDYYIDFADAHNAIYVHAGGSQIAYNTLAARKTDNIDGTNGNVASTQAFYRDQERRRNNVPLEHTLFTSGSNLATAISKNKFTTTLKNNYVSPFKFSQDDIQQEGEKADYIYIPFSTYAQSYFDFDPSSGVYKKGQYVNSKSSLDKHDSPHIDGNTGEQITFENVLVLYTKYTTVDNEGRKAIQFTGTGKGYYFCDGIGREISWSRKSRTGSYTLCEADGKTEVLMNPGKTYIAMVDKNTSIVYK